MFQTFWECQNAQQNAPDHCIFQSWWSNWLLLKKRIMLYKCMIVYRGRFTTLQESIHLKMQLYPLWFLTSREYAGKAESWSKLRAYISIHSTILQHLIAVAADYQTNQFIVKLVCSITNLISGREESSNCYMVPSSILTVCWSLELSRRNLNPTSATRRKEALTSLQKPLFLFCISVSTTLKYPRQF